MRVKVAGGCGEHGRNCFLVNAKEYSFLVDCGILAGASPLFPRLSQKDIQKIRYVFLTHSHADHSGALPWLYENGFDGTVIAPKCTFSQLPFPLRKELALEDFCTDRKGQIDGMCLEYGRSGHCMGSVWYHFVRKDGSILFSGDYTEHSLVYRCDPIRSIHADYAVVDCAYGRDNRSFEECCDELIEGIRELKRNHRTLFLPVPKYGRGMDLLVLLQKRLPELSCCGDTHLLQEVRRMNDAAEWYLDVELRLENFDPDQACDIVLISDPQLRSLESRILAEAILEKNGYGVMTGTLETNSFSESLVHAKRMQQFRFPVHQNHAECHSLLNQNSFERVILYHSPEIGRNTSFACPLRMEAGRKS